MIDETGNEPGAQDPGIEPEGKRFPTLVLTGIGAILLVAAILLYPLARQRMAQERIPSTQTAAPAPELPAPSPTPSPAAPAPQTAADPAIFAHQSGFGTLVLSIREGTDIHLFAYQPFLDERSPAGFSGLPLTRLTSGPYQDIHPAISPDGRYIAFASNRGGPWDIYILDLASGDLEQFTASTAYDGNPSWSPDGQWLAYESYQIDNLEILLQDRERTTGPIPLTRNPAADYAPDWSGQGRWISFISTRSGRQEVWYADLDSTEEDKSVPVPNLPGQQVKHPAWSPDGRYLAWAVVTDQGNHSLVVWDSAQPSQAPEYAGTGDWPCWAGGGELLYTVVEQPGETYLTGYPGTLEGAGVMLPAVKLSGPVEGISWIGGSGLSWPAELSESPAPTPLWEPGPAVDGSGAQPRADLLSLRSVTAPTASFHQDVLAPFSNLRAAVTDAAGWDFLSTLENAYVPLDQPLPPGVNLDWLHTGRGIALNDLPRLAGWLALVREDYGGLTYWRVYLRTQNQQGWQGRPLHDYVWDFNARYSGNNTAYENGGSRSAAVPPGYWVDFSALAGAYGWSSFPAERYWQSAEQASRYGYFAFTQGYTLAQALRQVHTEEALAGFGSSANP